MEKNQHTIIEFYQHVGKLFYAVALSDNKLDEGEFDTLKNELSTASSFTELLAVDKTLGGKHHILSAFTLMFADKVSPQICYDEFIAFKKKHEELFTASVKENILSIAGKIASSFSNRNKSELIMLAKLSIAFKK